MSIDNRTLAAQEFEYVAAQLTDAEIAELDRRVVAGQIISSAYSDFDYEPPCGCIFGTISILRNPTVDEYDMFDVAIELRDEFLYGSGISANENEGGVSPLEDAIYRRINHGDTPGDNETSAWLHGLLSAEIARRAARQNGVN